MQVLVLGSGSRYKRELLARLKSPFSTIEPDVDESPNDQEDPAVLARRLAETKASAVCDALRERAASGHHIVIAADQVAVSGDTLLHKPGTEERAFHQLSLISGKKMTFYTALYIRQLSSDVSFTALDRTTAHVRSLTSAEIRRYIEQDRPLDCAGSFKVESLGISLFEQVTTDDPTALIGLPLIAVAKGLRALGQSVP